MAARHIISALENNLADLYRLRYTIDEIRPEQQIFTVVNPMENELTIYQAVIDEIREIIRQKKNKRLSVCQRCASDNLLEYWSADR